MHICDIEYGSLASLRGSQFSTVIVVLMRVKQKITYEILIKNSDVKIFVF